MKCRKKEGAFIMGEKFRRREDRPLKAPNAYGNVWPNQSCPVFMPRGGAAEKTCWYCVFADFHLDMPRALKVGICCWPGKAKGGRGGEDESHTLPNNTLKQK
jgi:hypothetical protein